MGLAAWLIWDELTVETRESVEAMMAAEASEFVEKNPYSGLEYDTMAEENAWGTTSPALAANMFPDHEQSDAWREAALQHMMNSLSTAVDAKDDTVVDGRAVSEWIESHNIHPDYTLENHGFFHPDYASVAPMYLGDSSVFFGLASNPVPGAATHHVFDMWELLQNITTATGEWAYPSGLDWSLHSYENVSYLAWLATYFDDPVARTLESREIQYAAKRQRINDNGRFVGDSAPDDGSEGFYRDAVSARRIGFAYLHHKLWGADDDAVPYEDFARAMHGTTELTHVGVVIHRTPSKFASASWLHNVMGNVTPESQSHLNEPYVITPDQRTLIGRLTDSDDELAAEDYTVTLGDDGFATAAELREGNFDRYVAILSLPGSPVVQLERAVADEDDTLLRERGVPLAIENDELTGGKRTLFTETGERTVTAGDAPDRIELDGHWANVDDRLGMVVLDGSEMVYVGGRGYNRPGARKDMWYGSHSDATNVDASGTDVINRAAIVLPNVDHSDTKTVATAAESLQLPQNVVGIAFSDPGERQHIALANLGPDHETLTVEVDTGGDQQPVREVTAEIDGLMAAFATWQDGELVATSGNYDRQEQSLLVE
ncbi:hypothetical protein [Halocatena marina]|uniref:hypothetical protein n=1 Tax=Halocatena marina TaxID=2934937 RepID=UPI00223132EB|nr:hypothetical protein [Halocatena marina]